MGVGGNVQQMRESFEDQFEAAGQDKYLYRRNQKGEPIPVAAGERERFIQQYIRRIWFILGGMIAVLMVFVGLVVWRMVSTESELPEVLLSVGLVLILAAAVCLMYWVRGAPARELEGRTPVGGERSTEEMRAIFLKKLSYSKLGGTAVMGVILPFTQRSHPDLFHGWGRLWLVFGAAIVLLAGIQAFRKWRFESDHSDEVSY